MLASSMLIGVYRCYSQLHGDLLPYVLPRDSILDTVCHSLQNEFVMINLSIHTTDICINLGPKACSNHWRLTQGYLKITQERWLLASWPWTTLRTRFCRSCEWRHQLLSCSWSVNFLLVHDFVCKHDFAYRYSGTLQYSSRSPAASLLPPESCHAPKFTLTADSAAGWCWLEGLSLCSRCRWVGLSSHRVRR